MACKHENFGIFSCYEEFVTQIIKLKFVYVFRTPQVYHLCFYACVKFEACKGKFFLLIFTDFQQTFSFILNLNSLKECDLRIR